MGKWKSLRFDPLEYVNFKTVSAFFLGSLIAAWILSHLFAIGLFFIGLLLLLAGEWYAREIYRKPMDETYKSVIIGHLIFGAGLTLASIWINIIGVSQWLQPVMWVWCVILCGGPQIAWQRRKIEKQANKNNVDKALLGDKLSRDSKD
jgi:hypothetical protein